MFTTWRRSTSPYPAATRSPRRTSASPSRAARAALFPAWCLRRPQSARGRALHGSVGNYEKRGYRYGLPLAELGVAVVVVAVLVVETYASRADLATSFIGRALQITETMFDTDAYAGLKALATRPDIDAAHVALMGFSHGGMATTYALYDTIRPAGPGRAALRRARRLLRPASPASPTAGRPVRRCSCSTAAGTSSSMPTAAPKSPWTFGGGSAVDVIVYPDAVHQWDGEMRPRLRVS